MFRELLITRNMQGQFLQPVCLFDLGVSSAESRRTRRTDPAVVAPLSKIHSDSLRITTARPGRRLTMPLRVSADGKLEDARILRRPTDQELAGPVRLWPAVPGVARLTG